MKVAFNPLTARFDLVSSAPDVVAASTYVHHQAAPSATWTVPHGLGFYPNVTVIDSAGDEIEGVTSYVDENSLTITFSSSLSGEAYLS